MHRNFFIIINNNKLNKNTQFGAALHCLESFKEKVIKFTLSDSSFYVCEKCKILFENWMENSLYQGSFIDFRLTVIKDSTTKLKLNACNRPQQG